MVVVLLLEPPALRPADRIPTLHVFTSRAPRGLSTAEIAGALSLTGPVQPIPLEAVGASGHRAGTIYTPFVRVATAGLAARRGGRTLSATEVPEWMRAPVVYVAFPPLPGVDPSTLEVAVVPEGTPPCCRTPQPTLVRPLWVGGEDTLRKFGAEPSATTTGLVAAFPLQVLAEAVDFVAFYRVENDGPPRSVEARGRVPEDLRAGWRD